MKKTVSFSDQIIINTFVQHSIEYNTKMEHYTINNKLTDTEIQLLHQFNNISLLLSNIVFSFKQNDDNKQYINKKFIIEFNPYLFENVDDNVIRQNLNSDYFCVSNIIDSKNNIHIDAFIWDITRVREWEIKIFLIDTENNDDIDDDPFGFFKEKKNTDNKEIKKIITIFKLDMQGILEDYLIDIKKYFFYDIFTGIIFNFNTEINK